MSATTLQQTTTSYGSLLRGNRNFCSLWLGQLVSLFGDRLHQVALLVLVGSATGNDLGQVALVFVAMGAPPLLFGPFAGALVDRWDRRRVMIGADLVRVPLVLSLPLLARVDLLWVYAVAFALETVGLLFRPAKNAVMPAIVPERDLTRANSLSMTTDTAVDVLGFPLAGALVAGLWGLLAEAQALHAAFYVDAATYAFSALMIHGMAVDKARPAEAAEPATERIGRMVLDGLRFLRSNRVLLTNTVVCTLAVLLFFGSCTLSYGYAMEVTGTGAFGYATLEAALGLGAVVGGLAVGRWGERLPKGPVILAGILLMGATDVSMAFFSDLWLAAALVALGGAGNMLFVVPSMTLAQRLTPDELLGRVSSIRLTLGAVAGLASNAAAGVAAERYGVQPMLGLTGGLLVALGLVALLLPSARRAD